MEYAKPLAKLVGEFEKLPGIGPKSAQRLAFHVLRMSEENVQALATALIDVKQQIKLCPVCFNYTDQDICALCSDAKRDRTLLCVVAEPRDAVAIEKTNEYRGVYHVLGGVISPMDGVGPEMLRIRPAFNAMSLYSTYSDNVPLKLMRTVSGTRSQVLPVAQIRATSVEPMPLPNAPTAP